jgi:hypothetical protein
MGMEQSVAFEPGRMPAWPPVRDFLAERGYRVEMRMIDGELAFPDEEPPETWRELRVGTPGGMVTLRREADRVRFVVWGNADEGLRQGWNALVWASAAIGSGQIEADGRTWGPDEYREHQEVPPSLKGA